MSTRTYTYYVKVKSLRKHRSQPIPSWRQVSIYRINAPVSYTNGNLKKFIKGFGDTKFTHKDYAIAYSVDLGITWDYIYRAFEKE